MTGPEQLKAAIYECGAAGAKVLSGEAGAQEYQKALKAVLEIMKQASPADIEGAGYPVNIQNTLLMDRHLIEDTVTDELDQLSLLSTVVTYIACSAEGMRGHSMKYMDRVTELRKELEKVYDAEAMRFCGSDGC